DPVRRHPRRGRCRRWDSASLHARALFGLGGRRVRPRQLRRDRGCGPAAPAPDRDHRHPGGDPMMRVLSATLLALFALPAAAGAQSLFSTRGLGVPVAPVDARARALGGIGVGLIGWNGTLANPAEAAGVLRRGVVAAMQPSRRSVEFGGEQDDLGGTRFPLIRAVQPLGSTGLALAVGYGGFLDQNWAVVDEGAETIGGQPLRTRDLVESTGGVAQARLDVAYWVTPRLGVGVGAGVYTGRLDRV